MITTVDLDLSPRQASNKLFYVPILAQKLQVKTERIQEIQILRKSIDARRKPIKVKMKFKLAVDEKFPIEKNNNFALPNVKGKKKIIVIGAGPAGLFAALKLIESGYCPIVLERGKCVEERKKDVKQLYRTQSINPNSNYAFGEGGAGCFSDGKLYSRSKKKGNQKRILEILHFYGAQPEILYEAQPHIGTDVLPKVIVNIRKAILRAGGEVHFSCKVEDFIIENNSIKGVISNNEKQFNGEAVLLATGHSARDVYRKLHKLHVSMEAKDFAMGVRIEFPQKKIDQIQYHSSEGRGAYLPAASFRLVHQTQNRGVYSFCMCPGGIVVPAATDKNQQVVNGMSASRRNTAFANSGILAEIRLEDVPNREKWGVLAGLHFQEEVERKAFLQGGQNLTAPAQRMIDFVEGRKSSSLPQSSYRPGIVSSEMHKWLPKFIVSALQEGFKAFGRKSQGFLTNDAIILGVETRSSSPIRIPRNRENLQHISVKGLFPCGEGAGYAGGIMSAAIDGEQCAEAINKYCNTN